MNYNFGAIRELIQKALTTDDFDNLVFDNFRDCYKNFTPGQTQNQRIIILLDCVIVHDQILILLEAIEKLNPRVYEKFSLKIRDYLEPSNSEKSEVMKCDVLVLTANPTGTYLLELNEEARLIKQSLQEGEAGKKYIVKVESDVKEEDISKYLLKYDPRIVHFSGHGNPNGEIIFNNPQGQAQPVSPVALAKLFDVVRARIDCVVLNACFSLEKANALAEKVSYVVGMCTEIGDESAITFAKGFYLGLGSGETYYKAFEIGRHEIEFLKLPYSSVPKFITRDTSILQNERVTRNTNNTIINKVRPKWNEEIKKIADQLDMFDIPDSRTDSPLFIPRKIKKWGSHEEPESIKEVITKTIEVNEKPFKAWFYGCSGLGKTSILKRIAIDYSKEDGYITIPVSLKRFSAKEQSLLQYIYDEFNVILNELSISQYQFYDFLKEKKVIFLLDSLDSGLEDNKEVWDKVKDFVSEYNSSSYIITREKRPFDSTKVFEEFDEYDLADFTQEEINQFVHNWFNARCTPDTGNPTLLSKNLIDLIEKDGNGAIIAWTPLHLSFLCQVFWKEENAKFIIDNQLLKQEQKRLFLYKKAISSLLTWDKNRELTSNSENHYKRLIDNDQAFDLFSYLAFKILSNEETSNEYVRKERLQELIRDFLLSFPNSSYAQNELSMTYSIIIDEIEAQDGILTRKKHSNQYCFIHSTILEFFGAIYLIRPHVSIPKLPNNNKWKRILELANSLLECQKIELSFCLSSLIADRNPD